MHNAYTRHGRGQTRRMDLRACVHRACVIPNYQNPLPWIHCWIHCCILTTELSQSDPRLVWMQCTQGLGFALRLVASGTSYKTVDAWCPVAIASPYPGIILCKLRRNARSQSATKHQQQGDPNLVHSRQLSLPIITLSGAKPGRFHSKIISNLLHNISHACAL